MKRCGPSYCRVRKASAVPKNFGRHPKKTSSTLSAQSGRPAGCEVAQELGAVARFHAGQVRLIVSASSLSATGAAIRSVVTPASRPEPRQGALTSPSSANKLQSASVNALGSGAPRRPHDIKRRNGSPDCATIHPSTCRCAATCAKPACHGTRCWPCVGRWRDFRPSLD